MMPDGDGLELVPSLRRIRPDLQIIVISAQNSLTTSIKAKEAGVFGYLPKPFDLKELTKLVNAALAVNEPLALPRHRLTHDAKGKDDFPLIGKSKGMQALFRAMGKLVADQKPTLFVGQDGVGKTLAAQTLHDFGENARGRIVFQAAASLSLIHI